MQENRAGKVAPLSGRPIPDFGNRVRILRFRISAPLQKETRLLPVSHFRLRGIGLVENT